MKHRERNKTKIKVNKQDRIQSADELQFDACCGLVREVLINTYETYKNTYIYCYKNKEKYRKVWKLIAEYEQYKEDKLRLYACNNKLRKTQEDLDFIKEMKHKPKITRPKQSNYIFYRKYLEQRQELDNCIWFYNSARYRAFCLNNYVDGNDVMKKAREEIKGELK